MFPRPLSTNETHFKICQIAYENITEISGNKNPVLIWNASK